MKKGLKRLLALIILPAMLLVGGCDLFKEDEKNETQEEMFDKYLEAISASVDSSTYTLLVSIEGEESDSVSATVEYNVTKDKNGYYESFFGDDVELRKSVVKGEKKNQYIEYGEYYEENQGYQKYSKYVTLEDFDDAYSLMKFIDGGSGLYYLKYKTENKMRSAMEEIIKETFEEDDEASEIETSFEIKKENKEYVLEVSSSGTGTNDSEKYCRAATSIKVHFGDKVNKVIFEISLVEINEDGTEKNEGYVIKSKMKNDIKYTFDSSLDMTDFSEYPTPSAD